MLTKLIVFSALLSAQPLPEALFSLRGMDMHLHSGLERDTDLDAWLDLAIKDGRRVVLMLDHLELYRKPPSKPFPASYASTAAFLSDMEKAANKRKDLIIFKGWEIYEGELDTGFDEVPMRGADAMGWHISPNHAGSPPDGRLLIRRAKQIKEAQKRFPVPMMLFHPLPCASSTFSAKRRRLVAI